MTRRLMLMLLLSGAVLMVAALAAAQERTGPPPELRRNLDAFQKGFNTSLEAYEAMARATFSPAFYESQTAEQRAQAYKTMRADFGTIAFTTVERDGPDAPLVIQVKGSTAPGTFWIDLDEDHRVAGIRAKPAK